MGTRSLDELLSQPPGNTYTVSQLNREVRALLEASYSLIWVEGEVSNLVQAASGHQYFSLKDEQAQVRCALFKGRARNQKTHLKNGLLVKVRARVSLYEGRGEFQLIAEQVEDAGEGLLQQRFNELVAKLRSEGLFEPENKKALPILPRRVGVITSPTGAVIHDIITTLKRRFPMLPVRLYPVAVQGDEAAAQITRAIHVAVARSDCDVLIIGRGGGSLEDLWPFNEESVARAMFACPIPVISAVGHETDVTIADFISDVRAPTPTAAAEMISPDRNQLLQQVSALNKRLLRQTVHKLQHRQQQADYLAKRLVHPASRLRESSQALAAYVQRIMSVTRQRLHQRQLQLNVLTGKLARLSPASRIADSRYRCQSIAMRSANAIQTRLDQSEQNISRLAGILHSISPLATLERGYALTIDRQSGSIIRSVGQVKVGSTIETRIADGSIVSKVTEASKTKK